MVEVASRETQEKPTMHIAAAVECQKKAAFHYAMSRAWQSMNSTLNKNWWAAHHQREAAAHSQAARLYMIYMIRISEGELT